MLESLQGKVTTCAVKAPNTIKEFTMDKTWGTAGRSRILMVIGEELPETKPVLGKRLYALHIVPTNKGQRKAPHANRTSEDTAFQSVNLEIRMFSCQNVLEAAPRERAKAGENRKERDVRS